MKCRLGFLLTENRQCVSKYDLATMKKYSQNDSVHGIDSLPQDHKAAVLDSLEKGELVVPLKSDKPVPAKKSRVKQATEVDHDASAENAQVPPRKKVKKEDAKAYKRPENVAPRESSPEIYRGD